MDYLTISMKQKEWARNRAIINSLNERLSNSQHRAIALLCYYRHYFHKNMCCLHRPETSEYTKFMNFFLKQMPVMLHAASLPELSIHDLVLACDNSDFEKCIAVGEQINKSIEDYLKNIDNEYGTWYAPTGFSRYNYLQTA